MNAFEERAIENRVSAQKRAEVKLDSPRSTAKRSVRRPADATVGLSGEFLRTLFLTLLVMAATALLLFARLTDRPTALPDLRSAVAGWFGNADADGLISEQSTAAGSDQDSSIGTVEESAAPINAIEDASVPEQNVAASNIEEITVGEPELMLLLESDFSRATFPLARVTEDDGKKWLLNFIPGENVYRIRVFPGHAAWSTLGYELMTPFRVETSAVVIDDTFIIEGEEVEIGPEGYSGLLARYQDEANFYLFNVDGEGQTQLLSQIDGEWRTVSPWTPTVLVNPAGQMNVLAVEDDGQFLRFFINGAPIHEVEPMLEPGLVGLAGGTKVQNPAESNFEWLRIYGIQTDGTQTDGDQ